ncbi:MAG: hypothetical protein ABI548_10415 [Polyangiaceae bacterium]
MKAFFRTSLPCAIAFTALAAGHAFADQPKKHKQGREGEHPAFLHALSDLRLARANLQRTASDTQAKWDERHATSDIDAAIKKIKEAAYDDGKNLSDHPSVDAALNRPGHLHHALEALDAARRDVAEEEDDAFVQKLKIRALKDIDSAVERTQRGLCEEGEKAFCK